MVPASDERLDPLEGIVPDAVMVQLEKETTVRYLVEGLGKVKQYDVYLLAMGQVGGDVVDGGDKLAFARSFFPETVLTIRQDVVVFKVRNNINVDNMF